MKRTGLRRKTPLRSGCGKVRYRDEIAAKFALARIEAAEPEGHAERSAYYHGRCRGWHLTSMAVGGPTPGELQVFLGVGVGGRPLSELRGSRPTARKPLQRRTPLRQVSKKRAAEIRKRRAMLKIQFPGITLCEVPYCNRVADDAHEPLTRARGGSITDPSNIKAVCRPHHDEITFEEPPWAYDLGFLVHSWDGAA